MKKLLGIVVLGLFWCNIANAKEILLSCEKKRDENIYKTSIVLKENEQKLIINGNVNFNYETETWNKNYIIVFREWTDSEGNNKKIKYMLDRITGSFGSPNTQKNKYQCSIKNKSLF